MAPNCGRIVFLPNLRCEEQRAAIKIVSFSFVCMINYERDYSSRGTVKGGNAVTYVTLKEWFREIRASKRAEKVYVGEKGTMT
jgi:hypothetical protein